VFFSFQQFNKSYRYPLSDITLLAVICLLVSISSFASAQTVISQESVPVLLKITDYPGEWPESVPVPIGLVNMGGTRLKKNKSAHLVLYQTFFPDLSEATSSSPGKDYILIYAARLKKAGFVQTFSNDKPEAMNLSFEKGKYKIDVAYGLINTPTSKEQIEIEFIFNN
jgi:hypothetical protein